MVKEMYSSRERAYEAELNRLVSEGVYRKFTDEENIYMAQQRNEGMEKFLLKDKKDKIEAEIELSKIFINF